MPDAPPTRTCSHIFCTRKEAMNDHDLLLIVLVLVIVNVLLGVRGFLR